MKFATFCILAVFLSALLCSSDTFSSEKVTANHVNKEQPGPDLSTLAVLEDTENPNDQEWLASLKRRRQMLNWHRYAAWTTVALMATNLLIVEPKGNQYNIHKWVGITAGVTYATAATLAYFAPKIAELKQTKNILFHKKLIWIHAPAFVLAIVAGLMSDQQHHSGTPMSTFTSAHPTFATIAAISFGLAALTSMDWTINFIPPINKKEIACFVTKTF